jgi:hypothetical protein
MSPKAFKCLEKPIFPSQTFFVAIIFSTYILQWLFILFFNNQSLLWTMKTLERKKETF